jgi:hypothetical protein
MNRPEACREEKRSPSFFAPFVLLSRDFFASRKERAHAKAQSSPRIHPLRALRLCVMSTWVAGHARAAPLCGYELKMKDSRKKAQKAQKGRDNHCLGGGF